MFKIGLSPTKIFDCVPFLHLLLHVYALLLQKLSLSESPIHRLHRGFSRWRLLSLSSGLFRMVKSEHMVLSHNYTVTWKTVGWKSARDPENPQRKNILTLKRTLKNVLAPGWPLVIWRQELIHCVQPTQVIHVQMHYSFTLFKTFTWAELDCILDTLPIDICFRSLTGHQHDDNLNKHINKTSVTHSEKLSVFYWQTISDKYLIQYL